MSAWGRGENGVLGAIRSTRACKLLRLRFSERDAAIETAKEVGPMFDWVTPRDREAMLREIISEHERNLELERERLEGLRLEEAKLRFSTEILEEHGEHEEAERVRSQLHDAEHRVKAAAQLVERGERLLGIYRQKLEQLQRERQT